MGSIRRSRWRRLATTGLALAAAGAVLAGCGTPAVVKPVQDPLPGFEHDIQAAQNAAAQTGADAQDSGVTGVTAP